PQFSLDVDPEIRGMCLQELGLWVQKFPASFLSDGHLKYLGWSLHDKGQVRLRCVRALRGIYGIPEAAPGLELFTCRFKVGTAGMLGMLGMLGNEALSAEDCRSVFPVVFVSSRALATAAGKFLFHR
uniref:SCD domain-containing protein n=1 Tax=Cyanistes caeruleus TaxID=156563 RepID=A0A8C0V1Z5_CYACU